MTEEFFGPNTIEWQGTLYRTILSPEASGGSLSIVDSLSPALSGPPRHVHDREDEIFIVLSGEMRFWMAGQETIKGPGETVFVPRGIEHTFRVTGAGPSRHIVILTPGGFEGFFAEMAAGQFAIPEDMGSITEAAGRHHLRFTGPPLADH